jgi:hypothetical protein
LSSYLEKRFLNLTFLQICADVFGKDNKKNLFINIELKCLLL